MAEEVKHTLLGPVNESNSKSSKNSNSNSKTEVFQLRYHFSTSRAEIKTFQASIYGFIQTTRCIIVKAIIKKIAFFQAKGIRCCESQERISKQLGCSRKCVNETVGRLVDEGILILKKDRRKGSRWLHNVMYLNPIMYTREVVEDLLGIINYNKFKKYFKLSSVTLIKEKLSQIKNLVTKSYQSKQESEGTTYAARKFDELLQS